LFPCLNDSMSPYFQVSRFPCLRVSMYLCFHVFMFLCHHVSMSPCFHFSMFPWNTNIYFGILCSFFPRYSASFCWILLKEIHGIPLKYKLILKKFDFLGIPEIHFRGHPSVNT
jgi:hypothetical protein